MIDDLDIQQAYASTLIREYYELESMQRKAMMQGRERDAIFYHEASGKKATEHFYLTGRPIPETGAWKPFPII